MVIIYKTYEPDQGLEEIQARLFTQGTGIKVTSEEIKNRIKKERTNPNFLRYAFSEEGKALAYIQARKERSHIYAIGYPWATPNCPSDVQNKLFDDLQNYLLEKNPDELRYWIHNSWKHVESFFLKKGFKKTFSGFRYEFNVTELSKLDFSLLGFTSRLATHQDLEALIKLAQEDEELGKVPELTEEALRSYFTDKVLKDGHCILISDDKGEIVNASAPLRDFPNPEPDDRYMILRFTATRPNYHETWKLLLVEIAKECIKAGWIDLPLGVNISENSPHGPVFETLNPRKVPGYNLFTFKVEK